MEEKEKNENRIRVFRRMLWAAVAVILLTGTWKPQNVSAASAPAAPRLVSVAEYKKNGAVFTWKRVKGASGYRIYRRTEKTAWKLIGKVDGKTLKYTDQKLTKGKRYYYTVKAYKISGKKTLLGSCDKKGVSFIAGLSLLRLNKSRISINRGEKYTLSVMETSLKPVWETSDPKIASVSASGRITGKKAGKARITATLGEKIFTCTVTVMPVFKVSDTTVRTEVKKETSVLFSDEYSYDVLNYEIADKNMVSCSWGSWEGDGIRLYITGKKAGTTQITVSSEQSRRKLILQVTVKAASLEASFKKISSYVKKNGKTDDQTEYRLEKKREGSGRTAQVICRVPENSLTFSYRAEENGLINTLEMKITQSDPGKSSYLVKNYFCDEQGAYCRLQAEIPVQTYTQDTRLKFKITDNHYDMAEKYIQDYANSELKLAMKMWNEILIEHGFHLNELGFTQYKL